MKYIFQKKIKALDFGKKKKKKKVKEDLFKDEEATPVPAAAVAEPTSTETAPTEGGEPSGEATEEIDFGKKRKPKSKVKFDEEQNVEIEVIKLIFFKI